QPAESEPSLSGTCCGAWLDGRSPVSYALQLRSTRVLRCCRSMQLGHSTTSPGLRCWRRCMRNQRYSLSSLFPHSSTPRLAATCGRTTEDAAMRSAKLRAASKGTPSCPGCTPWPRTLLCKVQSQLRDGEAVFAFLDDIYVESTSLLHLSGSSGCMSTSRSPCGSMRASASTAPKPRPGMPLARNRRASGTSSPRAVIRYGLGIGRCPRISRVSSRWARRGQTTCCEYCPTRSARNT
ncbi:unnamed protein product, partial [Symbiodinium pilosum]